LKPLTIKIVTTDGAFFVGDVITGVDSNRSVTILQILDDNDSEADVKLSTIVVASPAARLDDLEPIHNANGSADGYVVSTHY